MGKMTGSFPMTPSRTGQARPGAVWSRQIAKTIGQMRAGRGDKDGPDTDETGQQS